MGRIPSNDRRRRAATALATAGILAALAPATAGAATLNSNGSRIDYSGEPGEVNTLTIERLGNVYRFTDAAGITIMPSGDCSAVANVGTCPVGTVFQISAPLDDENDTATATASLIQPVDVNLFGQEGNDTLTSAAQTDTQLSGDEFGAPPGNDILTGGPGSESIFGGDGNDAITGGGDEDRIGLEAGNDTVNAGPGDDSFTSSSLGGGPEGVDLVSGGPGRDRLDLRNRLDDLRVDLDGNPDDGAGCPGPGCEGDNYQPDIEDVDTGEGSDTVIGSDAANRLGSEGGNDLLQGLGGNDSLNDFGESDDRLVGGPGEDSFFSGEGADESLGGPGDDSFSYEFFDDDTDVFRGGGGFDTAGGSEEDNDPIRVSLNGRADDGLRGGLFTNPKDNVGADVEDIAGTLASDVLIGSGRPNQLSGLDGRDRLVGRAGQDALFGSRGRDLLAGGKGRDSLDGGGGPDRLSSRDGRPDEIRCGSSIDRLKGDRADRFGPDCDQVSLRGGR